MTKFHSYQFSLKKERAFLYLLYREQSKTEGNEKKDTEHDEKNFGESFVYKPLNVDAMYTNFCIQVLFDMKSFWEYCQIFEKLTRSDKNCIRGEEPGGYPTTSIEIRAEMFTFSHYVRRTAEMSIH